MDIKVCGNTDRNNLEALLALMPEQVGFIFYPGSKRCVADDDAFRNYVEQIGTVKKTGVFVNATPEYIENTVRSYRLDYVQLHGHESPEDCRRISGFAPVIKAFGVHEGFDFNSTAAYEAHCWRLLFDTATAGHGGSGQSFNWNLLRDYHGNTPFILSGGMQPGHVQALRALRHPAWSGIDLNSGFETSTGIKDITTLKQFIYDIRH